MLRLSGELPILEPSKPETACRSCCKKFGFFTPGKRCHHCGYHYCKTCATQGWASWPDGPINRYGIRTNHLAKNVCCFCVEFLRITSAGTAHLSSSDFSREHLLQYALAYNIIDPGRTATYAKPELVAIIVKLSKDGCNCLPYENERYYRQYSVPNNIPKSEMGSSAGILQYSRPLRIVRDTRPPWVRPPIRISSNRPASSYTAKASSVSSADKNRRLSLPASQATAQAPATSSPTTSSTLCVICQDEEANIAIVSCGHLALCKQCSDAIMDSTRHCPLCRTEISTKDQLLRIYKP